MASVEECRNALERVADALAGPAGTSVRGEVLERTVSCRLTDLDVVFAGMLRGGALRDVSLAATDTAQIRLVMTSADLIELANGSLSLTRAWASGRVAIRASVFDLIKLRSLL